MNKSTYYFLLLIIFYLFIISSNYFIHLLLLYCFFAFPAASLLYANTTLSGQEMKCFFSLFFLFMSAAEIGNRFITSQP